MSYPSQLVFSITKKFLDKYCQGMKEHLDRQLGELWNRANSLTPGATLIVESDSSVFHKKRLPGQVAKLAVLDAETRKMALSLRKQMSDHSHESARFEQLVLLCMNTLGVEEFLNRIPTEAAEGLRSERLHEVKNRGLPTHLEEHRYLEEPKEVQEALSKITGFLQKQQAYNLIL